MTDYYMPHAYKCSPYSGAGNCVCGGPVEFMLHPHEFRASKMDIEMCTCTKPKDYVAHRGQPVQS